MRSLAPIGVLFFLIASATCAKSETYHLKQNVIGEACLDTVSLDEVVRLDAQAAAQVRSRSPEDKNCIPRSVIVDETINVIAFQGKYAFICDALPNDDNRNLPKEYKCLYMKTSDIVDKNNHPVPEHYSKESPSPHFFDQP